MVVAAVRNPGIGDCLFSREDEYLSEKKTLPGRYPEESRSCRTTGRATPAQGFKIELTPHQEATSEIVLIFPVRDERHVSTNR